MAQTAVCNRHHSLDQQLCRWLLLSLDRLASNELVMTQELIANMPGVRREGVTEAAGNLQHAGLIHYSRGHITVLDRAGLDARTASAMPWSRRRATVCCPIRLRPDSGRPIAVAAQTASACLLAATLFALNVVVSRAAAQSPAENAPPVKPESMTATASRPAWLEAAPVELKDPTTAAPELCRDKPGDPDWLSQMRAGLYRTMCSSAAWFDGFFGNARFDDEYQAMHGSVAVGAGWDQRDHWDPSVRFRARVRLPQLSERFDAFIGKVDPEEYVTELRDDFDTLPRQFAREQDDAVLLGLGYGQPGRGGGHFDAGVGAKLGWPLEPYAKGTYRYARPFLGPNLIRLREAIFWEEQEHFGATTRIDLERLLAEDYLLRWTSSGTFTEKTQGVRWFSNLTLYQNLGNGRAFAYQGGVSGESDHEAGIVDYGLRVIFRRRIHREWLFLELRSSITWPRETLLERRESNLGAGAAIELMFGERRKK